MQARLLAREDAERVGRIIASEIPSTVRPLLRGQRMAVAASLDERYRPWASLLTGPAGFIQAVDDHLLRVAVVPPPGDPLAVNLRARPELGLLEGARRERPRGRGDHPGARGQGEGGHPRPATLKVMTAPAADEGDEALAARAAAGEELAFEELVSRYQARVYRLACRLTADEGDAKDVLQETFLAVYRGLPAFRGGVPPSPSRRSCPGSMPTAPTPQSRPSWGRRAGPTSSSTGSCWLRRHGPASTGCPTSIARPSCCAISKR